jgi:hypothetical protein
MARDPNTEPVCAEEASKAFCQDLQFVLDYMIFFISEKCTGTYIGPNAYPATYGGWYDPNRPYFGIGELHRHNVWCRSEEDGGCMFCDKDGPPVPDRAHFKASNAHIFGVYDHPKYRGEFIAAAKRGYKCAETAIPLRNDAERLHSPVTPLNNMSVGPLVDKVFAQFFCGSMHTMDTERLLNVLKNDNIYDRMSRGRTFAMVAGKREVLLTNENRTVHAKLVRTTARAARFRDAYSHHAHM